MLENSFQGTRNSATRLVPASRRRPKLHCRNPGNLKSGLSFRLGSVFDHTPLALRISDRRATILHKVPLRRPGREIAISKDSVSFKEFEEFLRQCGESDSRLRHLPRTTAEFEIWWEKMSVSAELQERWTRRVRLGAKFLEEITSEVEAVQRAA